MSQVKGLCVMDVDGTLILEEVIDLLGREVGREEEISQITSWAMRGEIDFESSLRKRVSLCTAPQKLDRKNLTFGVFYYEIEL